MAARMDRFGSWARAASSVRGSPRNTMPEARVKPMTERPPIRASPATQAQAYPAEGRGRSMAAMPPAT